MAKGKSKGKSVEHAVPDDQVRDRKARPCMYAGFHWVRGFPYRPSSTMTTQWKRDGFKNVTVTGKG